MFARKIAAGCGSHILGVLVLTFGGVAAHAQTATEAELEQQRRAAERERNQREALQRGVDVFGSKPETAARPEPTWPLNESPCFLIQKVVLEGDGEGRFSWALAPLLDDDEEGVEGRCIGIQGVAHAVQLVQQRLIERGYVTSRVLVPPQDLSRGLLTLELLPGRISAVTYAEPRSGRKPPVGTTLPTQPGEVLNLRHIEQALENMRRVPTVQADIQIVPGAQPGESDLQIRWEQSFPFRLNFSVDDGGSKSTGRYQANTTVSYDHWWTLNDLFYITAGRNLGGELGDQEPGDRGARNTATHYSVPFGYWSIAFNTSRYSYHQTVAGVAQDYVYSGRGAQQDATLTRLLYRDATSKTTVGLQAFARQSKNFIDDTEIEVQRRRTGGWALDLEYRTQIGGAQFDSQLTYKRGTGAFGALSAPEEELDEGRSHFALFSLQGGWAQSFELIGFPLQWSSRWRGQRERTPLTPQDRFSIGGRYSVRGFDGESSLAGERGWWWRNELSTSLGSWWSGSQQVFLGVDHGQVDGPSAQKLVGQDLSGIVLGLRGQIGQGRGALSFDLFCAAPLDKPEGFQTADTTTGFQLSMAF
ncbi:ShlB/FhaC/HecB family hemolysin secretion/activation protein [Hylemonella gracilis]|uniref:ShlB/FhaC/HecB family hemolysin secretion/activation protein n=1 Tax=Hylemonella gracilis TaxID=80880 RepID=UPI00030D43E7|nr:ShlB/FhaC/HecB family hemolysin secretion/activation protein [Hylemonella gracilis]